MKPDTKVVLLGQENIGKTCLIHRLIKGKFRDEYENTIGAAFCSKRMNVESKSVVLGVWDTAGAEKFEAMSRQYIRNSDAGLICYDINDHASFEKAKHWIMIMKRDEPQAALYLVGTKCDIASDAVDQSDADSYALSENCKHIRTSSKEDRNVTELFYMIARDWVSKPVESSSRRGQPFAITGENGERRSCCLST